MTRRGIAAVGGLVVVACALVAVGVWIGGRVADGDHGSRLPGERRDFLFQVLGVHTPNQGGQTINLYFHYRYDDGITEHDIPDYLRLRKAALDYLATTDLSKNPYWETLNRHICTQLAHDFPIQAISCELQAIGNENPGAFFEPGYHASVQTIGDIEPLAVLGPSVQPR
jgi:hypothetical protein